MGRGRRKKNMEKDRNGIFAEPSQFAVNLIEKEETYAPVDHLEHLEHLDKKDIVLEDDKDLPFKFDVPSPDDKVLFARNGKGTGRRTVAAKKGTVRIRTRKVKKD
jgi:hypothetical protein